MCRAQARRYGGAQRLKKCLARACGLEGLEKILGRGEINPALLDQLGARLVSESVAHHAYDLLLGKGLLLRLRGQRKNHRDMSIKTVVAVQCLIRASRKQEWELRVL